MHDTLPVKTPMGFLARSLFLKPKSTPLRLWNVHGNEH